MNIPMLERITTILGINLMELLKADDRSLIYLINKIFNMMAIIMQTKVL